MGKYPRLMKVICLQTGWMYGESGRLIPGQPAVVKPGERECWEAFLKLVGFVHSAGDRYAL